MVRRKTGSFNNRGFEVHLLCSLRCCNFCWIGREKQLHMSPRDTFKYTASDALVSRNSSWNRAIHALHASTTCATCKLIFSHVLSEQRHRNSRLEKNKAFHDISGRAHFSPSRPCMEGLGRARFPSFPRSGPVLTKVRKSIFPDIFFFV